MRYSHSLALACACACAHGQTGTLDQVSPAPSGPNSAGFNVSASSLVWQSQIRCGVAGTLEGIRIKLEGPVGAQVAMRIRAGPAWNTSPALFDGLATKATPDIELVFVNTAASNIDLAAEDLYVMELQGNDSGTGLHGSHVGPPGTPLYPEPLFLNGAIHHDGGWRHGFETYMLEGSCYPDCNEDGSLTVADFACFQTRFVAGDPYADCNGVGGLTVADFACFQTKFVAGCP
jgi:hypothetical protein